MTYGDYPFGRFITGDDVQVAVTEHLKLWLPTYLAEIGRRKGVDLPGARAWLNVGGDVSSWPADQLPAVVVLSPGIGAPPERHGQVYSATWIVGVGIIVASTSREDVRRLASWYGAAVRAALVQHASLGGFAAGTVWDDEEYDDFDSTERTLCAAREVFSVTVDDVLTANKGPVAPTLQPVPPVALIESHNERVERKT